MAEQLDQQGPGYVEPFGHGVVHLGVEPVGLPGDVSDAADERAGIKKTGSNTKANRVIGHDSQNMAARMMATPMTLLTTEDKVSVKACWAPSTSLFSRRLGRRSGCG